MLISPIESPPIPSWYSKLKEEFEQTFGLELHFADPLGKLLDLFQPDQDCQCGGRRDIRRESAAKQSLYWGDPVINMCCEDGYGMWAIPAMFNNSVESMVVVQGVDLEGAISGERIQQAADWLFKRMLELNLIPESTITLARQRALREGERHQALENSKTHVQDDLRSVYLREEAGLLSAIKEGELAKAREILNRILVGVYSMGGHRIELLKSCVLELVIMMSRAAVEAGADPKVLLGANYQSISLLEKMDDEEELARWIKDMLERLIDSIGSTHNYPNSLLLSRALAYMRDNLDKNLKRDEVARHAGVSGSHFSRLMTERLGKSFTDLLLQMRTQKVKDLLLHTDTGISTISLECGFFDQSHLTRTFKKLTGESPGGFRKNRRRGV